jgi:hypothetical protein
MSLTAIDGAKLARKEGLAVELRRIADAAERGEVEVLAMAWSENDHFMFFREGSNQDTLCLASLMHDWALRQYK